MKSAHYSRPLLQRVTRLTDLEPVVVVQVLVLMLVRVLVLVVCVCACILLQVMFPPEVTVAYSAMCLDRTPAGYYLSTHPESTGWVIYLQGG